MSTNEPQKSMPKSIFKEMGMVGLVLSFIGSEVTLSGLTVFLAKLVGLPGPDEISPILTILLTSFPLTISAAIIFVLYKRKKLTIINSISIIGGAVLASKIINIVLDLGIQQVPFRTDFCSLLGIGVSYLFNYLEMFGPFPFIKSVVLGYFFGKWYLSLAVAASQLGQSKKESNVKKDNGTN